VIWQRRRSQRLFPNWRLMTLLFQGYSDMAEKKVSEAISKLEADGLTVASCQKFLNLYGR
jgi:hypothetical protein